MPKNNQLIPWLIWNPEIQCRINKGSQIIPILSRNYLILRIDTNLFNVYSNILLPSMPRPSNGPFPVGLPIKMFEGTPTFR